VTLIRRQPHALFAQLACLWEATARKPGNVHRYCDFEDANYVDFVASAAAMAPAFDRVAQDTAGELILRAVWNTQAVARTNTNLGIILLLAPLALANEGAGYRSRVARVLAGLTVRDAMKAYEAIRLARPAGLGKVDNQDVAQQPSMNLREAMQLAADRDLIARQYANGFQEVFDAGVPALQRGVEEHGSLEGAIIACHLHLMAHFPDSLIARKCGNLVAEEAQRRAAVVLAAGWPHTPTGHDALAGLDAWLRADGHRRNPGTTADLVAASLFVALREGIITLPPQVPWAAPH
jgi:triphosphoribosyl-dephospho-CoA synthase